MVGHVSRPMNKGIDALALAHENGAANGSKRRKTAASRVLLELLLITMRTPLSTSFAKWAIIPAVYLCSSQATYYIFFRSAILCARLTATPSRPGTAAWPWLDYLIAPLPASQRPCPC
jgi:hypothetical protein